MISWKMRTMLKNRLIKKNFLGQKKTGIKVRNLRFAFFWTKKIQNPVGNYFIS